jgi:hypothetical protein
VVGSALNSAATQSREAGLPLHSPSDNSATYLTQHVLSDLRVRMSLSAQLAESCASAIFMARSPAIICDGNPDSSAP